MAQTSNSGVGLVDTGTSASAFSSRLRAARVASSCWWRFLSGTRLVTRLDILREGEEEEGERGRLGRERKKEEKREGEENDKSRVLMVDEGGQGRERSVTR